MSSQRAQKTPKGFILLNCGNGKHALRVSEIQSVYPFDFNRVGVICKDGRALHFQECFDQVIVKMCKADKE